jgi:hypothetical protein
VNRSGRSGTGSSRYRRNRAILLATSDMCGICGHGGARTADHIIPPKLWAQLFPDDPQGCDGLANLRPAHGTMAPGAPINRCLTCGRACNQSRGARLPASRPQSRHW